MDKKKITLVEKACKDVAGFQHIYDLLHKHFTISGKSKSTFNNYI